ncbi:MAG: ATP-binding protein [Planctomycetaceae bacterium]|nr:ATP-binding protein [Planctomycetaceae bacterium]
MLFGTVGTGKDHLLIATLRSAIRSGLTVEWRDGNRLFGDLRDVINSERNESQVLRDFVRPDILALSDPVPLQGEITEYQAGWLWRILDTRYRNRKSTFVTINIAGRAELVSRLGAGIADRLIDGALAVHCNWPSHRQPLRQGD